MKKYFIKILSVFVAGVIVVAGGATFINPSVEAASAKKPTMDAAYSKNAITKKVCSHTTVKILAESNRTQEFGTYVELDGTFQILLSAKKGTYEHVHKQTVVYSQTASDDKSIVVVQKTPSDKKTAGENLSIKDKVYTKNGSSTSVGESNQKYVYNKSTGKKSWSGTYASTTTKATALKKQYKCSHCQMQMSTSHKNVVMKTKCCGDTVKINIYTGEIKIYKKGKTVPSKDIGSFLESVKQQKDNFAGFIGNDYFEGRLTKICSHSKILNSYWTANTSYLNNKIQNVSGENHICYFMQKGQNAYEHGCSYEYEGPSYNNVFKNFEMRFETQKKSSNKITTTLGLSKSKNKKWESMWWTETGVVTNGTTKNSTSKKMWECKDCKMRMSSSGQTIIFTTQCCGDTVKLNIRTGKVTIV